MKSPELSALNEAIIAAAPGTTIFIDAEGEVSLTFPEDATQGQKDSAFEIVNNWSYAPTDWQAFQDTLSAPILFAVEASIHASLIFTRLNNLAVGQGAAWAGESDRLIVAWNDAPPVLQSVQEDELNAAAAEYNIPLRVAEGVLSAA